ncbi:MAG: FeoB small GTPase domain-containing protein, partial [Candidatus Hydrogenedentota bacterium]
MAVAIPPFDRPRANGAELKYPVIESTLQQANVLLVGNPNAGKTTLFNQLTGMRLKTANFPGTTLEVRRGALVIDEFEHHLYDMPGLYSLHAASAEEATALEVIRKTASVGECVVILIVDATNLVRNLFLAGQVLELGAPTVVALNMIDLSRRAGTRIDTEVLARHLGCPVVPLCARSGEGIRELKAALGEVIANNRAPEPPLLLRNAERPTHALRYDWAERVVESCAEYAADPFAKRTEAIDRVLTHPVSGIAVFASILFLVFYLIFSLATVPMDLIDGAFGSIGDWVSRMLGDGLLSGMLVDGVIAGVGGVLVFLPQICV